MSDPVEFLDLDDVLELAVRMLGEPAPVRDIGLLGSAVARPQTTAFGEDAYPDLFTKAAALLQSVVTNHALIDGNKRLGWLCTAVFLEINGIAISDAANDDVYNLVIEVASQPTAVDDIAQRLQALVHEEHDVVLVASGIPNVIHDSIKTRRLTLDPLAEGDADEMVAVLADASLYEVTGDEAPSLETLRSRYRYQTAGPDGSVETWHNWIIRTTDDQRAVGFVQATVTGSSADVAWLVGLDHQRCGIATEAAAAMGAWLVERGVSEIRAHIHPNHVASQVVASRIGLTPTGTHDDDGEEIWDSTMGLPQI